MNSHGLTRENLVATLPPALQKDPSAVALAETMADLLAQRRSEIEQLRIYPVIDRLDEQLLDILAYDFKVDWWDADYSLEEKRRTLKDSWRVHKVLGTKAAVETALRAIYPKAQVQEWFEYGGEPYRFKLDIDLTGELSDAARPWRVLERVNFYKSLRSHLDSIEFTIDMGTTLLHIGGSAGTVVRLGLPPGTDSYDLCHTLCAGGRGGMQSSLGIQEDTAPPPSTTVLRTGGVCTILSNLSKGE